MKHIHKLICVATLTSMLAGCATPGAGLLPVNEELRTTDIYKKVIRDNKNSHTDYYGFNNYNNFRPQYSKTTQDNITKLNKQFLTLPNPQIPMYIFAHRVKAGDEMLPVAGYTTVFHLYKQEQFALPGERY